jgi:hypothetical protein
MIVFSQNLRISNQTAKNCREINFARIIFMSVLQGMTESSVINVLSGGGVKKMKYFKFGNLMFSPIYLAGLADEIGYKYLHVEHDVTKDGSSGYDAYTNTIYLTFPVAVTIENQGMIVHEATHAMFDFQGKGMDIATSESLAYIAQCMYVRLNTAFDPNDPEDRLASRDKDGKKTIRDGVFDWGWYIAGKIIAANSTATNVYSVSEGDMGNMKKAVEVHPWYSSIAYNQTNFNGYR